MHHEKKLALITGASSGIGLELAKLFAKDGYHLIIVSDNRDKLERAAEEIRAEAAGTSIEMVEADLSQKSGADIVHAAVRGRTLDALVNNAGVGVYGDFTRETDLEAEISMIQLNAIATVQLTKLFAPDMVRRGSGRILNTASVASKTPTPYLTVYGATKAFVYEFSQGLREELRDTGVTVTALMPGPTETNFFARADAEDSKIMDQRMADPAEVAKAGYDALMNGESKVVTPLRYKIQTAVNNVIPDAMVAKQSRKMHEPKDEEERRAER